MIALITLIDAILGFYTLVLLVAVIMSWLFAFGVINRYNQVVMAIHQVVTALTEPVLRPIRKVIPPMGGLDLSILVLFFAILFLRTFLTRDLLPMLVR